MSDNYRFEEEEFDTQFNGGTLIRILQQVKPHWKWVTGFLVMIMSVAMFDSYLTYLGKRIIDEGIVPGDKDALVQIGALYIGIMLVLSAGVFGFIYLAGILGHLVQYDLRKKMFDHLQQLSFSYFDRTPVGWIMSRVTSDSERVAQLVTWGLLDTTWGIVNTITASVFMFFINWKLAIVVLIMIPVLMRTSVWFKKRILVEFRQVRKFNSEITGSYNESITGVRVTKSNRREEANLKEFEVLTDGMYNASYRAAWFSALFLPAVQVISAVAVGCVVYFGGLQAKTGGMTIGGIQAFVAYITFMMWPIQEMARVYAELQRAIASGERIFSLVDAAPDVTDKEGAIDPGTLRGDIEFDDVTFYYEEDKPVLNNFSLKIKGGETIALVGETGGGKSTILNLLCRFYEPKSGQIRINGQDYRDFTLHSIHSRLGIVLQTPHLFSGNIRENIRYGRLGATDAEIEDAAKLAGAHEFIVALEKGYEEEVGEGGNLLSVGQKQLISLARAVLAQPDIFIMDEATSSVDTLTEHLIQKGMEELMSDRTSFVIAHRLSTIKQADRILVIEGGKIIEMGSHAELIHQRGHYYNLYTRQFRKDLEVKYDIFKASEQKVVGIEEGVAEESLPDAVGL